ncbi:MAG TPA: type IV pilus assembly protein PilM [Actinomycetota bacterium]
MAKGRIGLDIGSTAVRAVEVTGGDSPAIVHAAQVPLPAGAVESGEVRDPEIVAEALKELWQRGGFKGRRVYMGVGNQRVVVREIALPYLPEKELRASLGFQVQEFIPMSVDEAVIDFDPLGEFEQDDRRMLRMLLVAAQRTMVDALVAAVSAAKLEPLGLDLVPFAIVRSVGSGDGGMDLEDEGDEAVIDIGAHVTNIVVHASGTTRFVRILPSGGRDVTIAIARALGVDDEIAEQLKRGEEVDPAVLRASAAAAETSDEATDDVPDQSAGPQRPDLPPGSLDLSRVREIAMQRAASFVDEIRSSLEFYTAQSSGSTIVRVVVTGGGSKLEGFMDLLRQRFSAQVEPGQVFQRITSGLTLSPEAQHEAEPLLAVAAGLAIPGRTG